MKHLAALLLTLLLVGCATSVAPSTMEEAKDAVARVKPVETRHPFFDTDIEFFVPFDNGEFTAAQRAERTETLASGERVFRDVGLTFYYVERGDTISEIRKNLGSYDEFEHVRQVRPKILSFNVPPKKLQAGMWIPVPMDAKDRYVSDEQFMEYARRGILELLEEDDYGPEVLRILAKVSVQELQASMIAIAKQESGGSPIGTYTYHRWEPHQRAFSFTAFHILMKGPGLNARRHLNLTEGQCNHPQNAVKLFLGYMIEKSREQSRHADRYFPIDKNIERLAVFYNGSAWKRINPHYTRNVTRYYREALD